MAEEYVEQPEPEPSGIEKLEARVIALEQVLGILVGRLRQDDYLPKLIDIANGDIILFESSDKSVHVNIRDAFRDILFISANSRFVPRHDDNLLN